MRVTFAMGLALWSLQVAGAFAQTVPAPPLDAPTAPLAGPPLNQPPRQLQPESDAASDPAMANASRPPAPLTLSKVQQACLRRHPGYDPASQSYVDVKGRRQPCG